MVKRGYKEKAKIWHPDKNVGRDQQFAGEQFKKVGEAYEFLSGLAGGGGGGGGDTAG